jgi:hypothetical protein
MKYKGTEDTKEERKRGREEEIKTRRNENN